MTKLTHLDYQGYGVYEFARRSPDRVSRRGYGALSLPTGMPDIAQVMVVADGIQVVRNEYQETGMTLLDGTSFDPAGDPNASVVSGKASIMVLGSGTGWASDYYNRGYAIMADIASVKAMSPMVLLTTDPAFVAKHAQEGGAYAVIKAPVAVLNQAKALVAGHGEQPVTPPVEPPNVEPPGTTSQASVGTPSWVWPAVIGVGALAVVAIVKAAGD